MPLTMKTCSACRRHHRRSEPVCPFCGAAAKDLGAPLVAVLSLTTMLASCTEGPSTETQGVDTTGMVDSTTTTSSASGSGTGPLPSTGAFESTSTGDSTTMDTQTGGGFIYGSPDGGAALECDVVEQDCPATEKCAPWAPDGGDELFGTRCVPLADTVGGAGEPCVVQGINSGLDDCDLGLVCREVDEAINEGTCAAMCTGMSRDPTCAEPSEVCVVYVPDVLLLCRSSCDPSMQDCADEEGCYPVDDQFACSPAGMAGYGDECRFVNSCLPGFMCVAADDVPGCMTSGCCTELCELDDPMGDAQCPDEASGQMCLPVFDGSDNAGMCIVP